MLIITTTIATLLACATPTPMEAPTATSVPTFSFGAHSTCISSYCAAASVTSVLGVPG